MKSEENKKIEIHIYIKISARTGERSYFYQIFMRRKQAIPLQGSELFKTLRRNFTGDCLNCQGMLWPAYLSSNIKCLVNSKGKPKIHAATRFLIGASDCIKS